jgi:hypothetical protein
MTLRSIALALTLALATTAAEAAPEIAVFDFDLLNTSPALSSPAELARTKRLGDELRADLQKSGMYNVISIDPVRPELKNEPNVSQCNGCELRLAKRIGAQYVAYGWVQKVSNLILNINLVIEDVTTGKRIRGGSVDIRGNTDQSWDRGLKFMLEEYVYPY